jgi:hypothetical protein
MVPGRSSIREIVPTGSGWIQPEPTNVATSSLPTTSSMVARPWVKRLTEQSPWSCGSAANVCAVDWIPKTPPAGTRPERPSDAGSKKGYRTRPLRPVRVRRRRWQKVRVDQARGPNTNDGAPTVRVTSSSRPGAHRVVRARPTAGRPRSSDLRAGRCGRWCGFRPSRRSDRPRESTAAPAPCPTMLGEARPVGSPLP